MSLVQINNMRLVTLNLNEISPAKINSKMQSKEKALEKGKKKWLKHEKKYGKSMKRENWAQFTEGYKCNGQS